MASGGVFSRGFEASSRLGPAASKCCSVRASVNMNKGRKRRSGGWGWVGCFRRCFGTICCATFNLFFFFFTVYQGGAMLRRFLSQAPALSWLSLWLSVPGSPCANKKPVKMEKIRNGNQRHTGYGNPHPFKGEVRFRG